MQLLIAPDSLDRELPDDAALLRADQVPDLHPALRTVLEHQPEFGSWSPSRLCLFYFGRVDADGRRARGESPRKAPLLGLWTVATRSNAGERREMAVELFTNNGGLERAGELAGLDLRRARSTVGEVPEDEEGSPSGLDRYQIRLGKTTLTWDGRPAEDSVAVDSAGVTPWYAEGRRGGWVTGTFTLSPAWTRAMIGSLKVEGEDEFARLLQASPIRFVGPGYHQGGASLSVD